MDSKIFDTENLLINAEDCQRLSYEMLFKDGGYQQENGHSKKGKSNGSFSGNHASQEAGQEELEKLEAEWRQKLDNAKTEAYQQGMSDGQKQGKEEALELMEGQITAVTQAVSAVTGRIDSLMDDLKPYMATMVFDVAEKIIGIPLKSKSLNKKITSEIRQILDSVEQDLKVKIVVAKANLDFIKKAVIDLPNADKLEITGSDSLQPGEYTIDTRDEHIVKNFKKMLHDFREKVALENDNEQEEPTSC